MKRVENSTLRPKTLKVAKFLTKHHLVTKNRLNPPVHHTLGAIHVPDRIGHDDLS